MHGSEMSAPVNEHEETRATTKIDLDTKDDVNDVESAAHTDHNQYGKTESMCDV